MYLYSDGSITKLKAEDKWTTFHQQRFVVTHLKLAATELITTCKCPYTNTDANTIK